MATGAISAYGTLFKMINSPGTPVLIADITNLDGPALEANTADVTPHEAAGSGWRHKIPLLKDGGQITGTMNFKPSRDRGVDQMAEAFASGTLMDCEMAWPESGEKWTFKGYVVGFQPHGPTDGALTADFTIEVTETVSFT
jgi:hypothetical protein